MLLLCDNKTLVDNVLMSYVKYPIKILLILKKFYNLIKTQNIITCKSEYKTDKVVQNL